MKKILNFFGTWTGMFVGVFLFIFFIAQVFIVPSGSMNPSLKIGDRILALKFSYGIPIPTLPIINQRILPDLFGTGHLISFSGPKKNDVVVFHFPLNKRIMFVKRCVATGGDQIIYTKNHSYFKFKNDFKGTNPEAEFVKIRGELWLKDPYLKANYNPEKFSSFSQMEKIVLSGIINDDNSSETLIDMEPIYIEELKDKSKTFHLKDKKYNAFYKKVPKNTFYMMGDNRDNSWDSRFWGSLDYKYIVGKMFVIIFSSELRNYNQVKNGYDKGLSDQRELSKVCSGLDINTDKCKDKWNNYEKGKVRTNRLFKLVQ